MWSNPDLQWIGNDNILEKYNDVTLHTYILKLYLFSHFNITGRGLKAAGLMSETPGMKMNSTLALLENE